MSVQQASGARAVAKSHERDFFSHCVGLDLAELDKSADEHGQPKREIVITCLQEGPGNPVDKRWYARKAVENLEPKIYARRKLFVDHLIPAGEAQAPQQQDRLRDWSATVLKTWLVNESDGRLARKVRLKIHEDWLWRRCEDAPGEIALSIEGRGVGAKGIVEGQEYTVVEDIAHLSAFKFVPYPGNAKMGADLVEGVQAADTQEEAQSMDLSKLTLEALREARPDLVAGIEKVAGEKVAADALKKVEEAASLAVAAADKEKAALALAEELKAKVATAEKAVELAEAAKAGDAKALSEQFRQEMKSGFAEQAKVIQTLREENHGLKQRLDEKEVRERLQAKDQLIDRLLAESELPDEAKTPLFREDLRRLTERKDGDKIVTIEEQISARLADRKKLCAGGAAVVTESGGTAPVKAEPQNKIEEQVVVDEAFRRKYSREYGMSLTPETVLVEWRKRQVAASAQR